MEIEFAVSAWAAYAPGLQSHGQWRSWAAKPCLPAGPLDIALPEVPALLRRRLSPLGRMAVKVAFDCAEDAGIPLVFASRYGDADRSIDVLRSQAASEAVSPTDFALAVHNAIGALYSIARHDLGGYTTVAAGPASAAAALTEAVGWLADGAPEVLVVHYDAPLPAPYDQFHDEPCVPYAWAWRIALPAPDGPRFRLSASHGHPDDAGAPPASLPFGLDAMRFIASDAPLLHCATGGVRWTWERHA